MTGQFRSDSNWKKQFKAGDSMPSKQLELTDYSLDLEKIEFKNPQECQKLMRWLKKEEEARKEELHRATTEDRKNLVNDVRMIAAMAFGKDHPNYQDFIKGLTLLTREDSTNSLEQEAV